ncbi:MAG: hypothetical protein A2Y28_03190 [Chlamydiae bacterium GWC2_50_10]|nr:MAG: hypothetical protein A2Z85_01630 [Chlamydiae bacterium GWA2_50_15]OGN54263.1 MAG: hypothetical protein A2Y28_03190 [Chlamydiae bacterium GWC2_50_10]OGN54380.1 MAG: hypothetical protein A2098_02025 [Chlamydiae bacterium GWF2_49_8]OGN58787.1 MAG: hypothetical protein A3D18_06180 [Chlamydiae bacterium RIFCSPHIGHO2_02_FULL_49_29]OGN68395.1 MAG: hypothetical protein A3I15_04420 [Chlamydiae bacterium RIFCSPLOWO2_02_FULL_49_12]OGN73942.1 MAG: hypothetical protein A3G30_04975 [Chlamydiae bacte
MKYWFYSCGVSLCFILGIQGAEEKTKEPSEMKNSPDVTKISEALGHLIAKNLLDMGIKIDIAQVVKGLKDSSSGKDSPLSEKECLEALSSAQEKAFKEKAQSNLKEAEAFLTKRGQETGVTSIEEGKLQYKVEKEGAGDAVQEHGSPRVIYSGKLLEGKVFGASKESEVLSLDELIPGLKKGLIGMKEGEKRTLYIHPDLGYGTAGMLSPNSLLIFEVEIVKAQEIFPPSPPRMATQSTLVEEALPQKELSSLEQEDAALR